MKIFLILAAILLTVIVVGLAVLGGVDIPAPSGQIEKPIPADRLPH